MTTNAAQINAQPNQITEITVKAGQALELTGAAVKSTALGANGALVVNLSNGGTVVIKNFAEVAGMSPSPTLALPNGQSLILSQFQPATMSPVTAQGAQKNAEEIVIGKPKAHENVIVKVKAGHDYEFGFDMQDTQSVKNKAGQLVITFKDGGQIIVPNYGAGKGAQFSFKDGAHLAKMAAIDGKSLSAEQLAEVEPAAGGDAGTGATGGHFNSSFSPDSINSFGKIGPIGITDLQYATFDRFPEGIVVNEEISPNLEVSSVWVKEDNSVQLDIHAVAQNGNQVITLTVTGFLPGWTFTDLAGGTYDSATGTWKITLPAGGAIHGGPTIAPPAQKDTDMPNLQVTEDIVDISTGQTATAAGSFDVFTDAVVDPVTVDGHDATRPEDTPVPLTIDLGASADTDGSESVTKIVLSATGGFPTGATFNHGTIQPDGTLLLTKADLAGLTMTPPSHFHGTINFHVEVTESESVTLTTPGNAENDDSDNVAVTSDDFTVIITNTVSAPTVSATDVVVKEDHSIQLQVHAHLNNPSADDYLTVSISNFKDGWTFNDLAGGTYDSGTHTWSIKLSPGAAFNGGPTVTPPVNSDIDMKDLLVTAKATDGIVSASATAHENVFVDAVIDFFGLSATAGPAVEDQPIALNINITPSADTDGSEKITSVVISGLPPGATLNHGQDLGGGVWKLTHAEIQGLELTTAPHYSDDFRLYIEVVEKEGATLNTTATGNFENDEKDNVTALTTFLDISVENTIMSPALTVADVWYKEDQTHGPALDIHAHLNNPGPDDYLIVTISGFTDGWTFKSLAGGTYDAATHTWTRTLAPGEVFNGGPNMIPPADSDLDLTGLKVTAVATDGTKTSAPVTGTENIFVDAVIDGPTLNVGQTNGSDNGPIAINAQATAGGDADGSEELTVLVSMTGAPDGTTLNHGVDVGSGVFKMTLAELNTLTITAPRGFEGRIDMKIVVTESEKVTLATPGNAENDLKDNTATIEKWVKIIVSDDEPTISINPNPAVVDETDMAPTAGALGVVTANYYTDTPGSVTAFGPLGFGTGAGSVYNGDTLMSEGVRIDVRLVGNTYTGWAGTKEVFTFTIQPDGQYTFTLKGTLDHGDTSDTNEPIFLNFAVTATDADGDKVRGTVTIKVLDDAPTANDDHNVFDILAGHTDGNVVTGLHGGPGAADDLSNDKPDLVTKIQFGSTIVNVPATGEATINGDHGQLKIKADGSYTYTLFPGSAGGGASDTPHHFTGNKFSDITLNETVALSPGELSALGQVHNNMVINANTQASGTITFDGAGYTNSLGAFTVGADGKLQSAQMLTTSITGPGLDFTVGAAAGAQKLGFFLVADGFTTNGGYAGFDFSSGSLNFVYNYNGPGERAAFITDGGDHVSLVFTDAGGTDHVIQGPVYFTTDRGGSNSLNPDGLVHTISGVGDTDTTLTIGFEDLPNGGDKDYNDVIFNVQLNDHVAGKDITDKFIYTLTDGDGDSDKAILTFDGIAPRFIVGTNISDSGNSVPSYQVGDGHGKITGGGAADILVGDVGGASTVNQVKNYNIALILDVSGSMGKLTDAGSKYDLLVKAVSHMLSDLHAYSGGNVVVNINPFDDKARPGGTFTVSTDSGYNDALAFLKNMGGGGTTNYEGALQAANTWLSGNGPQANAETYSYFISDGEPNHYVTSNNPSASGSETDSMNQILGSDGTNEVAAIKSLSDEVIGIGINIGSKIANLDKIDSDGHATNVTNPNQLDAALQAASPLNKIAGVGEDHLLGGSGSDVIFGDSLNTDALAVAQGINAPKGTGWDVFAQLEAGHGTNTGWTRADTVNYIMSHAKELAAESHDSAGAGRSGGTDTIEGGDGNDLIFGQEGNDYIYGGAGENTIWGGSGGDRFHIGHSIGTGVDTIKDFSVADGDILDLHDILTGYDPMHNVIGNFVSVSGDGHGNTIVAVDPTGGSHFQTIAVLEGVSVDLTTLTTHGNLLA